MTYIFKKKYIFSSNDFEMNHLNAAQLPIEELVSNFFHQRDRIFNNPEVQNRMHEIASYHNEQDEDFGPLLTEFCADGLYLEGIIALLENGVDPNIAHTYGMNLITRPLDVFIEYNSIHTDDGRKALLKLLDHGADINLICDFWKNSNNPNCIEIVQFCREYISDRDELSCKQVDMDA